MSRATNKKGKHSAGRKANKNKNAKKRLNEEANKTVNEAAGSAAAADVSSDAKEAVNEAAGSAAAADVSKKAKKAADKASDKAADAGRDAKEAVNKAVNKAASGKDALPEGENKQTMKSIALRWIIDILIAVVIAFLITMVIRPTIVKETSMLPNCVENDYLFIYKLAYKWHEPEKGDVVIFKSDLETENGKKKLLIKRVIGLPGDKIVIGDGKVYINGKEDDQSYTLDQTTNGELGTMKKPYVVPKGKVFCMGDNREVSIDSRDKSVGAVSESKLVGKVVFRIYRFSDFGTIKNPYSK